MDDIARHGAVRVGMGSSIRAIEDNQRVPDRDLTWISNEFMTAEWTAGTTNESAAIK